MSKINGIITSVVFVVIVACFTVAGFFVKDRAFSENENRYLAELPSVSVDSIIDGKFQTDYESYLTDQFVFRDDWIMAKTYSEILLGKKDINGVYLAKDDYFIEKHTDVDENKADKNAAYLIDFINKYSEMLGEGHVNAMIVPTADITLKDKLPAYAPYFDQNSYIDDLVASLGDKFIDVRDTLNAHSDEYIYYRTDHHWTTNGAYLAYNVWAEHTGEQAYGTDSFDIVEAADDFRGTLFSKVNFSKKDDSLFIYKFKGDTSYKVTYDLGTESYDDLYMYDHLDTKDKYSVFLDGNHSLVEINTSVGNGKNLLVVKDSYAHCMLPFLANHYENIYVIDLRYNQNSIEKYVSDYGITDVLVLYNTIHFATDNNLILMSK